MPALVVSVAKYFIEDEQSYDLQRWAVGAACILVVLNVAVLLLNRMIFFTSNLLASKLRVAIVGLIYGKVLLNMTSYSKID